VNALPENRREHLHPKRSNKQMNANGRRAFTLTEMLVSTSVILVLASLLTVAVSNAKRKAQSTRCVSNLKQHGIALQSFLADHSVYPLVLNPGSKLGIETDHYSSLWAALERHGLGPPKEDPEGVHVCPSGFKQQLTENVEPRSLSGYAYNVHGMGRRLEDEPLGLAGMTKLGSYLIAPVSESAVLNPAEMIAMGDGVRGWNQTYEDGVGFISRTSDAKEYAGSNLRVPKRHNKNLTILFADTHVSSVKLQRLFLDRDDEALKMWNRDSQPHRKRLTE
jgi:prepilin-type N-terminal cleavage/methylation domain-containing protein/prepilin-type processing-associated H-X9-DG protein